MAIVRQKQGRLGDGTEVTLRESWDRINGTVELEITQHNPLDSDKDINLTVKFTREEWEEFTQ